MRLFLLPAAVLLTLLVPASAAEDTTASAASAAASAGRALQVVALGDSVPSGLNCNCTPFPQQYGARVAQRQGRRVQVHNDAISGQTSGGLIHQLRGGSTATDVANADIVLITIGANDFGADYGRVTSGQCPVSGDDDCAADEITAMGGRVSSILQRVQALRAGRPTRVLVTGYWNVFEDGYVAWSDYGWQGVHSSRMLTRMVNRAIGGAAVANHARFVSLFAPFMHGGRARLSSLLADDGDHPSARGHALITRILLAA